MKKMVLLCNILFLFTIGIVSVSSASTINKWANSVIDYSTQWNSTSWGAHQALGAPDAGLFGDYKYQAWATFNFYYTFKMPVQAHITSGGS